MQKLTPFALIAATLLAGCAPAQKSRTWQTVKSVRHSGPAETQPSVAYAKKLHGALQCAGVEHKVVTLKFRHDFRILLRRDAEETAVIYRDPATPRHPWWLMAERLSRPIWLPTAPVASQAAFYLTRPVTVVNVEDYPANDGRKKESACKEGKAVVKPASHASKSKGKKRKAPAKRH